MNSIYNFLRINTFAAAAAAVILWAQAGASVEPQQENNTPGKSAPSPPPPKAKVASVDSLVVHFNKMSPAQRPDLRIIENASHDLLALQAYLASTNLQKEDPARYAALAKHLETLPPNLSNAGRELQLGFDTGYWPLWEKTPITQVNPETQEDTGLPVNIRWKDAAAYRNIAWQSLDKIKKGERGLVTAQAAVIRYKADFDKLPTTPQLENALILVELSAAQINSSLAEVRIVREPFENLGIPETLPRLKVHPPDDSKKNALVKLTPLPDRTSPPALMETWDTDSQQTRHIIGHYNSALQCLFSDETKPYVVVDPNTNARVLTIARPGLRIGTSTIDRKITYEEHGGWRCTKIYYGAPDENNRHKEVAAYLQAPDNTLYGACWMKYSKNKTVFLVFRVSPSPARACHAYVQINRGPWERVPSSKELNGLYN